MSVQLPKVPKGPQFPVIPTESVPKWITARSFCFATANVEAPSMVKAKEVGRVVSPVAALALRPGMAIISPARGLLLPESPESIHVVNVLPLGGT